jgi:hypothetical protein
VTLCSQGCYAVKIWPGENREPYWISRSYVKGQGHRVKYLGEGIRHALRCPCFYFRWCLCRQIVIWPVFSGVYVAKSFGFHVVFSRYLSVFVGPLHCLPFFNIRLQFSSLASWKCSHFSYFALLYFYIYSSIFYIVPATNHYIISISNKHIDNNRTN